MNWSKVDAGLAGALAGDDGDRRYPIFVHLATDAGADALAALGLEVAGEGVVRTASVSAADVARLSDLEEVSHLRLTRQLRLSDEA